MPDSIEGKETTENQPTESGSESVLDSKPILESSSDDNDQKDPSTSSEQGEEEKKSLFATVLEFVGELVHVIIISLAVIIPIRYFLIQPFYVKGASMEPSFYDHEYLIIDEISYRFNEPERGDIVVFRYPNDPRQFFIKRIIGLPGERVVVADNQVRLFKPNDKEGQILDEDTYLGSSMTTGNKDMILSEDEYFLMGDNRSASLDSRVFGAVPRDFIVGRVWFRGWPPKKIHFFTSDHVFE